MGGAYSTKLHAHEVVLVPDQCLRSLKSKMTASSSVNQPKGMHCDEAGTVCGVKMFKKFAWGIYQAC